MTNVFDTGYRLPAMPWSWLGAATPSAAAAAAVAAAAVTPSPAATPLVLAPRAATRRSELDHHHHVAKFTLNTVENSESHHRHSHLFHREFIQQLHLTTDLNEILPRS
ncbi:hypothetical protein PV325_012300 [Microctonus aethiopoides]|uniref:Uncharacterized protein n=1 Tax=Microctonus aethiopoides TaxID=144406 RepID=A0AA39KR50_9HYME|nr:hypothetical protein PV326_007933 [Microctonus aethiopoides]KAK0081369.1 hypothetical protein PV325_012300 [Microctonus aethiopoides]KAK0170694.1 hypothetical protein PV328_008513 [Microctonus aethiopoides]